SRKAAAPRRSRARGYISARRASRPRAVRQPEPAITWRGRWLATSWPFSRLSGIPAGRNAIGRNDDCCRAPGARLEPRRPGDGRAAELPPRHADCPRRRTPDPRNGRVARAGAGREFGRSPRRPGACARGAAGRTLRWPRTGGGGTMNATTERAPSGATRTIRTAAGSTAELVLVPDAAARRSW